MTPELRADTYGPLNGNEPADLEFRHPVFKGLDETDIIPFGGALEVVEPEECETLLTFVPPFPVYPPELSYMKEPETAIPGLILNENKGRVAYFPTDIDRCFARDFLPDFASLLANAVRWAAHRNIPIAVEGTGLIDCHLYRQEDNFILHLINLTNQGTWRAPMYEYIPVGPFKVRLRMPAAAKVKSIKLLVKEKEVPFRQSNNGVNFKINSITDHEVVVVEMK